MACTDTLFIRFGWVTGKVSIKISCDLKWSTDEKVGGIAYMFNYLNKKISLATGLENRRTFNELNARPVC